MEVPDLLLTKTWANKQLRFGIKLLQGRIGGQTVDRAVSDAIIIKNGLDAAGFWWQAQRMNNWIHRVRKKGDFL